MTFAVIGDFGEAGNYAQRVSALVKSWNPEFILTTGDNNYPSGEYHSFHLNINQYYCDMPPMLIDSLSIKKK